MPNYNLTELINSLNKEELRNFKIYISRISSQDDDDNKNLMLFDCIKNEKLDEFGEELVERIYPGGNKNAFYRLKNRLINDIEQSLLLLNRNKDPRFKVYNTIQIANIFRYKSDYEQAFKYLLKAEKAAEKFGYKDLLDVIYNEILQLAADYYKIDPEAFINKKTKNFEDLKSTQEVDFLISTINYQLRRSNYSEKEEDGLNKELEAIIERMQIDPNTSDNPNVLFKIHQCVRTILLQKKDFIKLERYLIKSLGEFEDIGFFDNARYEELFRILHWIINAANINTHFDLAEEYIERFYKALTGNSKKYYDKYLWIYHSTKMTLSSFTSKSEEAIEMMEEVNANPEFTGTNFYDIYLPLNLSCAYYKIGKLKKAMDTIVPLIVSKSFSKQSRSLQLRIAIVEVIYHFEEKEFNYVTYKIGELRRIFRKEFKQESYQREKQFLKIINDLSTKADPLNNDKIIKSINQFIQESPTSYPGSNEVIIYKHWLKAKIEKRSYGVIIQERMTGKKEYVRENIRDNIQIEATSETAHLAKELKKSKI